MGTAGQSITLANSIIGVGILAMPFCFQQCGVALATIILLLMGLISRLSSYFLLKAALIARRRNFEFLAFHVFGPAGKLAVEVGIIGFLMGTCIAYFVVVGDLGPQIIAKLLNINQSDILRTSIMVIVSLVCVLPLGLLRNVDSLSNVSAATIGFYFCLVIKVIAEATTQLFANDWNIKMEMWKPSGVLQCVPIFSMALFCQTQLFEVFQSLPTLSLEKMNIVTKNAINICTCVYFTLGLFGYIAFSSHTISGNILMSLSPTMASDVIKLGFVMSLAFSFPLIIFPCRASLYSFLYRKAHPAHHDHIINHSIPETTFRCMTVAIVAVALFISLLIPNIELVLGLVGSTIGVLICVVFPAACFVNVTFKNTNERVLAKGILILGLVIMVLGTYANLQAADTNTSKYDDKITPERIDKIVEDFFQHHQQDIKTVEKDEPLRKEVVKIEIAKDSAVQPPNPIPPVSVEKKVTDDTKPEEKLKIQPVEKLVPLPENIVDKKSETHPKDLHTKLNDIKPVNGEKKQAEDDVQAPKENIKPQTNKDKTQEKIDIIKQEKLIETIKQHGEEQKELIKEQKELLGELMKAKKELQQNKKEKETVEAKKIAVESIQKIADMAIKSISGVTEKPGVETDVKNEPLEKIANKAVEEIAKKAVEAIVEIEEQKPSNKVVDTGKEFNNNDINPNPVQNGQLNVSNISLPSVSNFAPINPPAVNQNSANFNPEKSVNPQDNGQINNIPQENVPIVNQIVQNAKSNSYNPTPVENANIPLQNGQQGVNGLEKQFNQQPSQENNNLQQQNQLNQQQNQLNQQQNQLNQQQNQLNQQQDHLNQQQKPVEQHLSQQQKRDVDNEINQQIQNVQRIQNNQPVQNLNENHGVKAHSHSPDEPQSYKQGEDAQKLNENVKNAAHNVPIPIAMNSNSINNKNIADKVNIYKDTQYGVNIVQNENNGAKNNPKIESNAVPIRQKREILDCSEIISLKPEDKEICELIRHNEIDNNNNKIDKKSEEVLSKVDLAEVGLKQLPMEILVGHNSRTLKSINHIKKKR